MESKTIAYELKSSGDQKLRELYRKINSRKEETMLTLKNEKVFAESSSLVTIDNKVYVIFNIIAENVETAIQKSSESQLEIDREFNSILGEVIIGKPLHVEALSFLFNSPQSSNPS